VTALHGASEGGHVECVRLLLDRGAGLDVANVSSWLVVRTHGWRSLCAGCAESLWMFVSILGSMKATGCVLEDVAVTGGYC
jgi:hypothetical protein